MNKLLYSLLSIFVAFTLVQAAQDTYRQNPYLGKPDNIGQFDKYSSNLNEVGRKFKNYTALATYSSNGRMSWQDKRRVTPSSDSPMPNNPQGALSYRAIAASSNPVISNASYQVRDPAEIVRHFETFGDYSGQYRFYTVFTMNPNIDNSMNLANGASGVSSASSLIGPWATPQGIIFPGTATAFNQLPQESSYDIATDGGGCYGGSIYKYTESGTGLTKYVDVYMGMYNDGDPGSGALTDWQGNIIVTTAWVTDTTGYLGKRYFVRTGATGSGNAPRVGGDGSAVNSTYWTELFAAPYLIADSSEYNAGTTYIQTHRNDRVNHIATAEHPLGPWTKHGPILPLVPNSFEDVASVAAGVVRIPAGTALYPEQPEPWGGGWRIYYKGRSNQYWDAERYGQYAGNFKLMGMAYATDAQFPTTWTKYSGNPIFGDGLNGSDAGFGGEDPNIMFLNGKFYMMLSQGESPLTTSARWWVSDNGVTEWRRTEEGPNIAWDDMKYLPNMGNSPTTAEAMGWSVGTLDGDLKYMMVSGRSEDVDGITYKGANAISLYLLERTGGSRPDNPDTGYAVPYDKYNAVASVSVDGSPYATRVPTTDNLNRTFLRRDSAQTNISQWPATLIINNDDDTNGNASLISFSTVTTDGTTTPHSGMFAFTTTGRSATSVTQDFVIALPNNTDTAEKFRVKADGTTQVQTLKFSANSTTQTTAAYPSSGTAGVVNTANGSGGWTATGMSVDGFNRLTGIRDITFTGATNPLSFMYNGLDSSSTLLGLTANNGKVLSDRIPLITASTVPRMNSGATAYEASQITSSSTGVGIGSTSPANQLHIASAVTTNRGLAIQQSNDTNAAPVQRMMKSKGSVASPTATVSGNNLGLLSFEAYVGGTNTWQNGALISATTTGNASDAAYGPATDLYFSTASGSAAASEKLRIASSGLVTNSNGGGVPIGSMYTDTSFTVAVASSGVWYEADTVATNFTSAILKNVTQSDHYMVAVTAGYYEVNACASLGTGAAGDKVAMTTAVNGTATSYGHGHTTIANASSTSQVCIVTMLNLAANDQVSMVVQNHSAARNIDIDHAQMTMTYLGSP